MFETNPQIIAITIIEAKSGINFNMSSKTKLTIAEKTELWPLANVPLIMLSTFPEKELSPKISVS